MIFVSWEKQLFVQVGSSSSSSSCEEEKEKQLTSTWVVSLINCEAILSQLLV